jgi:tetratricopeptide (TPR) repeat protein
MSQCSRCGEELEPGSLFCSNCGLHVEGSGPAPTTPVPLPLLESGREGEESYLKTGWRLFKQYPGGFIGFTALALVIETGLGCLPKVGWMVSFIHYPLLFGFVAVSARLIKGQGVLFRDFFEGFHFLVTLLLLGMVTQVLVVLGLLLLVVPGVYLMVGLMLAPWFVLDRRVGFWEALNLSRRAVQPHWFELFGLLLLIILINLLGALALGLGLLVTIPVSWCAITAAYATRVGFHAEPQPVRVEEAAGQSTAGPPGKEVMPQVTAGVAEQRLARKYDWAPVLTFIGFVVVMAAAGIYFWKFSPPTTPQKPRGGSTETSGKTAPPLTARGYLKKGNETKDFREKILFYTKAVDKDPKYAVAYNNRGNVYCDRKEYALALKDYNKAIAIKPDYVVAYYNRARLYFKRKEYDKALIDLDKVIKLKPNYSYAYHNRGMIYFIKYDDDQAIINFDQAIELKSDYVYSYQDRGNVYLRQKNYTAAINDYTKAIKLKPDFHVAFCNRGDAYFYRGDYDKALLDYNKALALKADYANAYYRRAILYNKTGASDKARTDYDKAVSLEPRWLDSPFPLPAGR